MTDEKRCEFCGREFQPKDPNQKYCSRSHRMQASRQRKLASSKDKRTQARSEKRQLFDAARKFLLEEFKDWGIHVHHDRGGSIYLQFREDIKKVAGAVRIADHPPRPHLNYRWQLRADIDRKIVDKPKPGEERRHYVYLYPIRKLGAIAAHIRNYYDQKIARQAAEGLESHYTQGNTYGTQSNGRQSPDTGRSTGNAHHRPDPGRDRQE